MISTFYKVSKYFFLLIISAYKLLFSRLINWNKPILLEFDEDGSKTEWNNNERKPKLTAPELIQENLYPVETHTTTTKDGYILIIHRIPHGRLNPIKDQNPGGKKVALLQHGLVGSSIHWLFNDRDKALRNTYMLADADYDVWMVNSRGNNYTRKHTIFSPKSRKFWDFSWHEMGYYDTPAAIDYILEQTGQEKLFYIGYSMGTTMFFVGLSLWPEYNSKIRLMAGLGSAVFLKGCTSPIRYLSHYSKVVLDAIGNGELLPKYLVELIDQITPNFYTPELKKFRLYENLMFIIAGFDYEQFNQKFIKLIMSNTPSTTSVKCLMHYLQLMKTGKFSQYDHGIMTNLLKYGSLKPPTYKLENITCPVALFSGDNDWICVPSDIDKLANILPNMVRDHRVNFKKWNHLDFIFGKNNGSLVHEPLLRLMEKY